MKESKGQADDDVVITEELKGALEKVFWSWLGQNWGYIESGGVGDVVQLFANFIAASTNASSSSCGEPKASHNSLPISPNFLT